MSIFFVSVDTALTRVWSFFRIFAVSFEGVGYPSNLTDNKHLNLILLWQL